jgi:predicted transcriptional regulator
MASHKRAKRRLSGNLGVRVDEETMRQIEQIAHDERRDNAEIARFAIEEYLERRKQQGAAA